MTSTGLMAAPFGGLVAGLFVGAAGLSTTLLVTGGVYLAVTLWPAFSASWQGMDAGRTAFAEAAGNSTIGAGEDARPAI
jgi:hypothetical protein